jgi:hypothetical protein
MAKDGLESEALTKGVPEVKGRWLTLVGIVGTVVYLEALWLYGSAHSVATLAPAEFGTFLGGVVSPLAFGWLVLGFFQQGIELRHSAHALWLQSEELRNSVEQQKALVEVTREQFEHERNERLKSDQEAERLARPNIGVQSNGSISSGGTRRYEFILANAGAMVTSVRLNEGETSFGEAATWGPGTGLTVAFSFEPGEELRPRTVTLSFIDARGTPSTMDLVFPVVEINGQLTLAAPH